MTRNELAGLLESERHPVVAEHIRAGADPSTELGDGRGGLRKALRTSRYADERWRRTKALYESIVRGELVLDD